MNKELINWLDKRLKESKTATIAFTGGLGSGKSYSCLSAADDWYRYKFNEGFPIENCSFKLSTFFDKILGGKLREGEIIILEETGALIPSKEFMNKINRAFGYYMQTFRALQVFVFFNLPVFKLMDSSTRILINANFITQGIDKTKNLCEVKPFFHQLNQQSGKIYPKYLRKSISNGGVRFRKRINKFYFKLPNKELRDSYEKKKQEFLKEYGEKVALQIEEQYKVKISYPHKCIRCDYQWTSAVEIPTACPHCRVRKWNMPLLVQNA